MTIAMLVSSDKYELPMIVCDSVIELAKKVGRTPDEIYSAMSRAKKRGGRCRYVKVEVEDE